MKGASIAASVLFAASIMSAGALAATLGPPTRKNSDDPVATLAIMAQLEKGGAAIVLDTGAASRGSGNANTNKEKDVRRWFVEQDLIEGVVYLPENLFYNTTAPGIILFLNKAKPTDRKGKLRWGWVKPCK